jgi:hypothetical protein
MNYNYQKAGNTSSTTILHADIRMKHRSDLSARAGEIHVRQTDTRGRGQGGKQWGMYSANDRGMEGAFGGVEGCIWAQKGKDGTGM